MADLADIISIKYPGLGMSAPTQRMVTLTLQEQYDAANWNGLAPPPFVEIAGFEAEVDQFLATRAAVAQAKKAAIQAGDVSNAIRHLVDQFTAQNKAPDAQQQTVLDQLTAIAEASKDIPPNPTPPIKKG